MKHRVIKYRREVVSQLGMVLALSFSLLLFSFDSHAQTVDICSRTDQIKTAILAQLPAGTGCESVDASLLANIAKIDASSEGILTLKAGDFRGLASLEVLDLDDNFLTSLPEDLFDGLTSLTTLALYENSLTSLHEDLFEGLTKLRILWLNSNLINDLPEDLFDGLISLEELRLYDNSLTSLPKNLFRGLTSLGILGLHNNSLENLPQDLFNGLTSLTTLALQGNSLTSLHKDLFVGLTNLERLALYENSLTSLHEDLFYGLTKLRILWLNSNLIKDLPEDLFDGLISLEDLWLYENSLTSLHEDLFDGLTELRILALYENSLTSLHEDLFDGLTKLRILWLNSNLMKDLPEDLFNGLTSLELLNLSNNSLTSLPEGLFDHMTNLQRQLLVWLTGNSIACLPTTIVNNPAVTTIPTFEICGDVTATLSLLPASISENGGIAAVMATLDKPSSVEIKIAVSAVPQSPASTSDYILSPGMLTVAMGQTTSTDTVTITAVDNEVDAPNKTITIQGSSNNTAEVTSPADVTLTITDDDNAPTVTLVLSAVSIPENGGNTIVTATLDHPSSETTTVTISTVSEPPATLADYAPSPNTTLTIAAGQTESTGDVTITAVDNDMDAPDKTITIRGFASNTQGVTGPADVELTIRDDDVRSLTAPASIVVTEGRSQNLEVALLTQPTGNVTVIITGFLNSDLAPTPQALTFTTTNWNVVQTIKLTAKEDDDVVDDPIPVTLSALGGGYTGVMHLIQVTITDTDVPMITAPVSVVVPEGGTADLPMVLSAQPAAEVRIAITGHVNTDLTPAPSVLTFTKSNWNITRTVVLTAKEDEDAVDDPVPLTFTASGGGYAGVTHSILVTITDNDMKVPLSLSIHDLEIMEDAKTGQLRVELNRPSEEVVTVQYSTSDNTAESGLDYTASRGIVIFEPRSIRGVIPVGILDDKIPEAEERLLVTLSQPKNAVIERRVGTLTILDNDGQVALYIEDEMVDAAEGLIRFRVHLSQPSGQLVSVAYRTEDGTAKAGEDYRASSGVVQFAPGTVTATIAVPLLKESLDWRQQTFLVHLERPTHARIAKAVAVAMIRESDFVARHVLAAYAARFVRTSSVQLVEALDERFRSHVDGPVCGAGVQVELARLWRASSPWTPSLGELLAGCRTSARMTASGGTVQIWGRGAFRQFHGQEEGTFTLRAEVVTGLVGVDYDWNGRWVTGLLLAHSRGEGTLALQDDSGELESRLTGIYPYLAYQSQGRGIWGTGGYGQGRAQAVELEGKLGSGFGALGFWGRLGATNTVQFTYYGDGIYSNAVVKRQDVRVEAYRLRLGLEADLRIREEVRPYLKANVRQDGGSAETGLGLELGAGIRVAVPAWRLMGDLQAQRLVMHTAEGFVEWGASGSVQFGGETEGLMVRVRPSWGLSLGMDLAHQQTVQGAIPVGPSLHRTEMELGYGVAIRQGTARSVLGATWQYGGTLIRLGGELRPRDRFTIEAFGLVHAHAVGEIGFNIQGSMRY